MACVICGVDTTTQVTDRVSLVALVCHPHFQEWQASPERRRASDPIRIVLSSSPHFADFVRRLKAERQNGSKP